MQNLCEWLHQFFGGPSPPQSETREDDMPLLSTPPPLKISEGPMLLHERDFHQAIVDYLSAAKSKHVEIQIAPKTAGAMLAAWPLEDWHDAIKLQKVRHAVAEARGKFYFKNTTGVAANRCFLAFDSGSAKGIVVFESLWCDIPQQLELTSAFDHIIIF